MFGTILKVFSDFNFDLGRTYRRTQPVVPTRLGSRKPLPIPAWLFESLPLLQIVDQAAI